jgi:hypothetical protein
MIGNYPHKINYIRAYIHIMKKVHVDIQLPQNDREIHMLNHCYYFAKNEMYKQGKHINV